MSARMVERPGQDAGLKIKVHPHMLRHACGSNAGSKNPAKCTLKKDPAVLDERGPLHILG
jgi:hypothetical protein